MFRISNEAELLNCFRPVDRAQVALPTDSKYPLLVRDYLSWVEPSGARTYLVFRDPEGKATLGIVFRRDQSGGNEPAMCEWCHTMSGGGSVALLTAQSSARRRVGIAVCRDISCASKIESDLHSDSTRIRVHRVIERMAVFARQNIF